MSKKRSYTRQHIDWSDPEQRRRYHAAWRRKVYKNEWRRHMRKKYAGTVLRIRVQTNLLRELEIGRL